MTRSLTALLLLALALASCTSGDDSALQADASASPADAASGSPDASRSSPDASSQPADATTPLADASTPPADAIGFDAQGPTCGSGDGCVSDCVPADPDCPVVCACDTTDACEVGCACDVDCDPCAIGPTAGFVEVETVADLAALAGVVCITQGLFIEDSELATIVLPDLQVVKGSLWIVDNDALTAVSMPALREVTDLRIRRNRSLVTADFGALRSASTRLMATDNFKLATLATPSLETVREINIVDNLALTSLAFPALTAATWLVTISDNELLGTVDFPALTSTGYDLRVNGNDALTRIDLSALTATGGDISAGSNPELVSIWLSSLENSKAVGLSNNPKLSDLRLASLRRVDGNLTLSTVGLSAISLPLLTEVTGIGGRLLLSGPQLNLINLPSLTAVGYLRVGTAFQTAPAPPGPAVVYHLEALASVAADMEIYGYRLTALDLPALASIGGELLVSRTGLTDLVLPALTAAGVVKIEDNPELRTVGLPRLSEVPGIDGLWVQDNDELVSLSVPELVSSFSIIVRNAPKLTNLAMPKLSFSDNRLHLSNLGITTWTAPALERVARNLNVYSNLALTTISFPVLRSPGAYMRVAIRDNPVLARVDLPGVDVVDDLDLRDNASLQDVDGFAGLRTVGQRILINSNVALTDLGGLFGVTSVGEDFMIQDNPVLPTAEANQLRDTIGVDKIGGTITISGNKP